MADFSYLLLDQFFYCPVRELLVILCIIYILSQQWHNQHKKIAYLGPSVTVLFILDPSVSCIFLFFHCWVHSYTVWLLVFRPYQEVWVFGTCDNTVMKLSGSMIRTQCNKTKIIKGMKKVNLAIMTPIFFTSCKEFCLYFSLPSFRAKYPHKRMKFMWACGTLIICLYAVYRTGITSYILNLQLNRNKTGSCEYFTLIGLVFWSENIHNDKAKQTSWQ